MTFSILTDKANITAAGVLMRDYPESPSAIVTICPLDEAEYHATEDLSNLDPDTDLCPSVYTFHARAEFGQFIPAAEARGLFSKAECTWVDFEKVWLGKFVALGWLEIVEVRRFKALGMPGQPDSTEYEFRATPFGWNVREAYWERWNGCPRPSR